MHVQLRLLLALVMVQWYGFLFTWSLSRVVGMSMLAAARVELIASMVD